MNNASTDNNSSMLINNPSLKTNCNSNFNDKEILLSNTMNKLELSGNYTMDGFTIENRHNTTLSNLNTNINTIQYNNLASLKTAQFKNNDDNFEMDIKNIDDLVLDNEKVMEKINTMKNQIRYNLTFWDNLQQHNNNNQAESINNPNYFKNKTLHNKILTNGMNKNNQNNSIETSSLNNTNTLFSQLDTLPNKHDNGSNILNDNADTDDFSLQIEKEMKRLEATSGKNNFPINTIHNIIDSPKKKTSMGNNLKYNINTGNVNVSSEDVNSANKKIYHCYTLNSQNNSFNGANLDENTSLKSIKFGRQKTGSQKFMRLDKTTIKKQNSHLSAKTNSSNKNSVFTFQNNLIQKERESIDISNSIMEV